MAITLWREGKSKSNLTNDMNQAVNVAGNASVFCHISDTRFSVKELKTIPITFGCIPENKGGVVLWIVENGFCIYEVDENGKMINQKFYEIPGYIFPSDPKFKVG